MAVGYQPYKQCWWIDKNLRKERAIEQKISWVKEAEDCAWGIQSKGNHPSKADWKAKKKVHQGQTYVLRERKKEGKGHTVCREKEKRNIKNSLGKKKKKSIIQHHIATFFLIFFLVSLTLLISQVINTWKKEIGLSHAINLKLHVR